MHVSLTNLKTTSLSKRKKNTIGCLLTGCIKREDCKVLVCLSTCTIKCKNLVNDIFHNTTYHLDEKTRNT